MIKVNWTAIGVVATSAIAGITGVATIVGAAQSIQTDVTVIKQIVSDQGTELTGVKTRVDFIYQQFFTPGNRSSK
jgi:hypothetical protein